MRNIHKYIMLFVMAFAVASCADDEIIENKNLGKSGDEVQFGLSLDNGSRTVYGDEVENTTGDVTSSYFPIYWVNGDKVQIFSPQCLEGRRNAEYEVILPDGVAQPNYAKDLEKTGDYGVQWGDGTDENGNVILYDFYSLYPSGNYKFSKDTQGNMVASDLRVKTVQEISYVNGTYTHDMSNCLMYATTPEVNMKDGVVNLSYHPLSTVLWFDVTAFKDNTLQDAQQTNFMITGVELEYTGTEGAIAGAFNYDVTNGKFIDYEEPYKKISVKLYDKSGDQELSHIVKAGDLLNFPIFLAPSDLDLSNLKITIYTDNGTFTKTLSGTTNFKPGKIHKITLPILSKTSEGWDVKTWMKYIPRNVYLSEISIPGSWNSLNPEFQANTKDADGNTIEGTSITSQYTNGVRAFHLDTRWQGEGSALRPTVSNVLGVADGGNTVEYQTDGRVMTDEDNPSVESALDEIIDNIKLDEYMILMCTFAQGSYNHSYTANNVTYDWVGEISRICSVRDDVYDAKELTSNTLVGDVLGKVIVIVNMEGSFTTVPSNSKCIFINAPLTLTSNLFGATLSDTYNKTDIKKGAVGASTVSDTGIDIYNTQAQVCISGETYTDSRDRNSVDGRGFAPTFGERKTVANNILDWSKKNYGTENYSHDKWIYLGLGGYYVYYKSDGFLGIGNGWKAADNGHKNVASDCNTWINGKVTEMGTTPNGATAKVPFYPVGIVLMNYVNTYASTVKNILLLNNKYRLQYDPKKPVDYDPNYYESGTGDDDNEVEEGI